MQVYMKTVYEDHLGKIILDLRQELKKMMSSKDIAYFSSQWQSFYSTE